MVIQCSVVNDHTLGRLCEDYHDLQQGRDCLPPEKLYFYNLGGNAYSAGQMARSAEFFGQLPTSVTHRLKEIVLYGLPMISPQTKKLLSSFRGWSSIKVVSISDYNNINYDRPHAVNPCMILACIESFIHMEEFSLSCKQLLHCLGPSDKGLSWTSLLDHEHLKSINMDCGYFGRVFRLDTFLSTVCENSNITKLSHTCHSGTVWPGDKDTGLEKETILAILGSQHLEAVRLPATMVQNKGAELIKQHFMEISNAKSFHLFFAPLENEHLSSHQYKNIRVDEQTLESAQACLDIAHVLNQADQNIFQHKSGELMSKWIQELSKITLVKPKEIQSAKCFLDDDVRHWLRCEDPKKKGNKTILNSTCCFLLLDPNFVSKAVESVAATRISTDANTHATAGCLPSNMVPSRVTTQATSPTTATTTSTSTSTSTTCPSNSTSEVASLLSNNKENKAPFTQARSDCSSMKKRKNSNF